MSKPFEIRRLKTLFERANVSDNEDHKPFKEDLTGVNPHDYDATG